MVWALALTEQRTTVTEDNDDAVASFSLQDPDIGDYFVVQARRTPSPPHFSRSLLFSRRLRNDSLSCSALYAK